MAALVPEMTSLRYRGVMRLAYSVALLLLMEHARDTKDDFSFGPWDLDALEGQGLVVSGPDLAGARKVLDGVPGLFLSDELPPDNLVHGRHLHRPRPHWLSVGRAVVCLA
jgi:hypothetical protein